MRACYAAIAVEIIHSKWTRETARARCAEILNERAARAGKGHPVKERESLPSMIRAREKLSDARVLAARNPNHPLAKVVLEMLPVMEDAVELVDGEGCLPGGFCTRVVKYGQAK
jgi:hypothetical protein